MPDGSGGRAVAQDTEGSSSVPVVVNLFVCRELIARAQKCADAATRLFITQTAGEVQLAGTAGDCS